MKTLQLLSFSSSGERSCPQDCVLSVNKDDLSYRDHQQYCRGLNREDLCCLMPCPMSQFFGDTECWKEARLCLQITLDSSPNLALLKKKKYLFIWLHQVLVEEFGIFSCGTWDVVPFPGIEPNPLHWERRCRGTPRNC